MKIILDGQKASVEEIFSRLVEFETENDSAVLIGSKAALAKIKPTTITKVEEDSIFRDGCLARYNGYECIPVSMIHKPTPFRSIFSATDFLITTKEEGYEIARHFNESVK